MCLAPPPPHQVLWAALLQPVQLSVHVRQLLVDVVQLCLQVFVLLVVAVELVLVVAALLLVCDWRKFTATQWKEETILTRSTAAALASSNHAEVGVLLPTCQSRRHPARLRRSYSRRSRVSSWVFRWSSPLQSVYCRERRYAKARFPPEACRDATAAFRFPK